MKNFNIEVISKKPETVNRKKYYRGRITVGDFTETFLMSFDNWTIDEYKEQWKEAIERIKTHDRSCLVADFTGLQENPWVELWVLYKENDMVFVQNHCFFDGFHEIAKGLPLFDVKTCYLYVKPRETITDGYKISEWKIDLKDVLEFRVI